MRNGKTGSKRLLSVFMLVSALAVLYDRAHSQADLQGRLILNYTRNEFEERIDHNSNQDLQLSVTDDLFVKNRLTINYFLERFTATRQADDLIRQRWKGNVVGRHYTFTGEFTPRYRLIGTSDQATRYATSRQFTLALSPPDVPQVSMTYDRNERTEGSGDLRGELVDIDRFVNTSYSYKVTNYRALFRERETENGLTEGISRRIRDFNGGAGINTSLPGRINLSADYDYLFSQDDGDPQLEGELTINNLSTRTSVRPADWLSGFTSFYGNYTRRENETDRKSSLSEVVAGVQFTPRDFLRLSTTRDYRITREFGEETISDFARGEVAVQGRIRERMEGKVVVNRTFIIQSTEGSFPSRGYLLSIDTELYPGVSLNSTVNMIQSEDPNQERNRFQLRRSLDLRMIPTGKIMLDFNLRTLSFGKSVPWLDTQVLSYGVDINYRPAGRFTVSVNFDRDRDRRVQEQAVYNLNTTMNYSFRRGSNLSVIYIRREARAESEGEEVSQTTSFSSAEEGILLQFTMKLRNQANLRLSFDTRKLPGGERVNSLGANLVTWF